MTEETKDVAVAEEAQPPAELTPMSIISQMVAMPDLDPSKIEKMMDLQERWENRQAVGAFNTSMAQFQAEIPAIKKNAEADRGIRFASFDHIMKVIQPYLTKHGLAVRFSTNLGESGEKIEATCIVSHIAGHSETSTITVPIDAQMRVNNSQKMGSANSYAKRYALSNALNLSFTDFDDDAAALDEGLSEEEVANIYALLEEIGADNGWRGAFLKWLGCRSIEEIPAKKYKQAIKHLEGVRNGNS